MRVTGTAVLALGFMAAMSTLSATVVAQQNYPNKPIRIVTPYAPGGSTSVASRWIGEKFTEAWGQQVIVDARGGGNTTIGTDNVAKSAPDGYTIIFIAMTHVVVPQLMVAPYDPIKDFLPIATFDLAEELLVVHPGLPVNNLKELLALAKSKGGGLSYGSWGVASGGHLVMEAICAQAGVRMNHVPYKTVAAIPNDLLSGVLTVSTIDGATPVALIKAGKLRAIASLSNKRLPQLPDVPTMGEQGYPLESAPWYGLFGPASMPADLVNRLNALLNKWLLLPETRSFFAEKQNTPTPMTKSAEEFAAQIQRELPVWRKMVADAKI